MMAEIGLDMAKKMDIAELHTSDSYGKYHW